ncbi:hypothetical protein ACMA1I_05735 [Pontibacter sp. 13R65]|uniref:hypothetical protein n=1 Tax=Pontibacter sp. 13R65 TaxID=3127458 RepID=UPI00301DD547
MKMTAVLFSRGIFFLIAILLSSCVALQGALSGEVSIHYIGESYEATTTVETFYAVQDVVGHYKVIGHMTNDLILPYEVDDIKEKMQEKAKQVGADAIIFTDLASAHVKDELDKVIVKAIAIKYL